MTILFETHATSLDNEAGLASGWFDVALSATGEQQARELGLRRRDDALDVIFCSDLARAWRTAELAFAGRVPIVRDARLRECDYGTLTRAPMPVIEAKRLAHISTPFPGGESYEQVTARVAGWLTDTALERTVLVIGHRAVYYAFEHLLRGVALHDAIVAPWRWQPGWAYPERASCDRQLTDAS